MEASFEITYRSRRNRSLTSLKVVPVSSGLVHFDLIKELQGFVQGKIRDIILVSEEVEIEFYYTVLEEKPKNRSLSILNYSPVDDPVGKERHENFTLKTHQNLGGHLNYHVSQLEKSLGQAIQVTYIYLVPLCQGCYYNSAGQLSHMEDETGCLRLEIPSRKRLVVSLEEDITE